MARPHTESASVTGSRSNVSWRRVALALGAALASLFPLVVLVFMVRGLEGSLDEPMATSEELARLSVDATQYLVTLATAVLGLLGFLMSEKLLDFGRSLQPRSRHILAYGAVATGFSLWTGFVVIQVVLRDAAYGVIRLGLDWVLWLHFLQVAELAIGVALIGWVFLHRIVGST